MAKTKQYRSSLLASVHETAEDLHAAGVMDKQTLREFDALCLTPVESLSPEQIRALRLRALSECDHRPRQPVGARREAPAGRLAQAARADRAKRVGDGGVKGVTSLQPNVRPALVRG